MSQAAETMPAKGKSASVAKTAAASKNAPVKRPAPAAPASASASPVSPSPVSSAPAQQTAAAEPAPQMYVEFTRLIERMHRRFLDVLRARLDRTGITDINPVQCLLLCNIGNEEINVRNLMDRGYYLGSNASYNIKKLVEFGYLEQSPAAHDRRSTILRVSPKGRELTSGIAAEQTQLAGKLESDQLESANQMLRRVERIWDDYIRGRL